jgi:hypothetical protein
MRIYPLSEGSFSIDQTKVFVPFDNSENTECPTTTIGT